MPTIGKIRVNLEGDTRRFQRSMRGANRTVNQFADRMSALRRRLAVVGGALGFGVLLRRTADEAILMRQLADRVGTTVDRFSRLARVLGRSGIELTQVGTIVQRLVRNAGDAAEGNERLAAAFQTLGIDVQSFIRLDPVEQFVQLGEALSKVENDNLRVLKTFRLLDTEGVKILQADLENLREELARTTGITDEQADGVTKAAAAWDKLKESFSSAMLTLGQESGAIGMATKLFEGVERTARQPIRETMRNVIASLAGQVPFIGPDLHRRILSGESLLGEGTPIRRLGPRRFVGGNLDFDLLSGLRQPTGQVRGEGLPPLPTFGQVTQVGPRQFIGGDLARSNQLLEQIRNNTAKQGAIAQ